MQQTLRATKHKFYGFELNNRSVKCYNDQFQLRHNIRLKENGILYYKDIAQGSVSQYDISDQTTQQYFQIPGENIRLVTFDVLPSLNLFAGGGFSGALYIGRDQKIVSSSKIVHQNLSILCNVSFVNLQGQDKLIICNNDYQAIIRDLQTEADEMHIFDFEINHVAISPNQQVMAVVGDYLEPLLYDFRTSNKVASFKGSCDNHFTADWNPSNLNFFASACQDGTCRIWDIRNNIQPFQTLYGAFNMVYNCKFSQDGQRITFLEAVDTVNIFDTQTFSQYQQIQLVGNVTGFAYSFDNEERLFIGVNDNQNSSLLQFKKIGNGEQEEQASLTLGSTKFPSTK